MFHTFVSNNKQMTLKFAWNPQKTILLNWYSLYSGKTDKVNVSKAVSKFHGDGEFDSRNHRKNSSKKQLPKRSPNYGLQITEGQSSSERQNVRVPCQSLRGLYGRSFSMLFSCRLTAVRFTAIRVAWRAAFHSWPQSVRGGMHAIVGRTNRPRGVVRRFKLSKNRLSSSTSREFSTTGRYRARCS